MPTKIWEWIYWLFASLFAPLFDPSEKDEPTHKQP